MSLVDCLTCLPIHAVAAKADPPKEVAVETPVKRPSITFATTKQAVEDRTEKLTGIGKAMVKSMQDALEIPHFGYCDEISCDSLIRYGRFTFEFIFAFRTASSRVYELYSTVINSTTSRCQIEYHAFESGTDTEQSKISLPS